MIKDFELLKTTRWIWYREEIRDFPEILKTTVQNWKKTSINVFYLVVVVEGSRTHDCLTIAKTIIRLHRATSTTGKRYKETFIIQNIKRIHTTAVTTYLSTKIQTVAPLINTSLTKPQRRNLAQLRTHKSRFLLSYIKSILHTITCTHALIQLTVLDLWTQVVLLLNALKNSLASQYWVRSDRPPLDLTSRQRYELFQRKALYKYLLLFYY